MKRLILLFIPLILLVGCSRKSDVKPILSGIEFDTRVCFYNECYEAQGKIASNGDITFNITSPENISGLQLTIVGDDVTAVYNGMEYKNDNPQLFGAFGLVGKVFADITKNNPSARVDDNTYSVEGRADGSEYELIVSTAGLPIELEADRGDLEMSFFNVKITE